MVLHQQSGDVDPVRLGKSHDLDHLKQLDCTNQTGEMATLAPAAV